MNMPDKDNNMKTLLEAVQTSLAHAGRYNPGDVVAPAAVLWTDADCHWQPVVEQLRVDARTSYFRRL